MNPRTLGYQEKYQKLAIRLTFSFDQLVGFYQGEWNGPKFPLKDDPKVFTKFEKI